jgi:hypothetical protein
MVGAADRPPRAPARDGDGDGDGDGNYNITEDGAVVDAVNVPNGCILIKAVGVTIKNSKANCVTTDFNGRAKDPANPRATIQDSEFDCGSGIGGTAIFYENMDVQRVDITSCENGFDAFKNMMIEDSYVHDLYQATPGNGDPHTDGVQSADGSNVTIDHNTIYGFNTGCQWPNDGSCNGTAAVNINNSPTGPTSTNVTISNNLLAGGAVALYCPRVPTSNFRVTDNHFSTVYSPKVGEFGVSTDCVSNEIVSGNVYHETGQPVRLP